LLEGLSVGDAFGERFFLSPNMVRLLIGERGLPASVWGYTDDTQMALSIVAVLGRRGALDQDRLASSFGAHYDISRGYGPAMHWLLPAIRSRIHWSKAAGSLFGGQGSFGNGSAMRVAPLGAYFADDLDTLVVAAAHSAEVTHAHPEATAGAIAVALAAAEACSAHEQGQLPDPHDFLDLLLARVPESVVRTGILLARDLPEAASVLDAVSVLGNGSHVTAQDTVPFSKTYGFMPRHKTGLVPASFGALLRFAWAVAPPPHDDGQRSPLHRRFHSPANCRRACAD
jgi:ADP-ribosylglycohydrolase